MDKLNSPNIENNLELPEVSEKQPEVVGGISSSSQNEVDNTAGSIERAGGERNQELMKDASSASAQQAYQAQDPQATTPASPVTVQSDDSSGNPQIADDVDLIEKEWVDKAKELVNRTKDDPRQQNIELGKIKADYIKKRFNKQLKLKNEG